MRNQRRVFFLRDYFLKRWHLIARVDVRGPLEESGQFLIRSVFLRRLTKIDWAVSGFAVASVASVFFIELFSNRSVKRRYRIPTAVRIGTVRRYAKIAMLSSSSSSMYRGMG